MNHPLKFVATTGIVLFFLMLKTGSLAAAREDIPGSRTHSSRKKKKISLSSPTLLCLMRRIWTSSWKNSGNT